MLSKNDLFLWIIKDRLRNHLLTLKPLKSFWLKLTRWTGSLIRVDPDLLSQKYDHSIQTLLGFRHNAGIKSLFPEPNGTKQIMLDVKASGYVFNPINDDLMIIRSFPENVKSVLWDNSVTDKEIFVVLDNNNNMHTFIINPDDVEEGGASVSCLGQTKVPQVKSYFLF